MRWAAFQPRELSPGTVGAPKRFLVELLQCVFEGSGTQRWGGLRAETLHVSPPACSCWLHRLGSVCNSAVIVLRRAEGTVRSSTTLNGLIYSWSTRAYKHVPELQLKCEIYRDRCGFSLQG